MYSADDIEIKGKIKTQEILSKISEYDIFKKYCRNFDEIDKSFLSEFYNDTRPSCRITQIRSNRLNYIDYGTGDSLGCFDYVMKKYCCNLPETCNIIANDFGLFKISIDFKPGFLLGESFNKDIKPKIKSTITINTREWKQIDHNYWFKKYNITTSLLDEYNVFPCSQVFLHKGDRTIVFTNTDENPIYAYRFESEGKYSYKIYFPLSKDKSRKWLFSGGLSTDIEGYDQIDLHGDLLILTKSLKDCICYRMIGYNAISLQGEANRLEKDLVSKLLKRYNKIIVNYDNDEQGIKSSHKIAVNYNFRELFIPLEYNCKDLSELIENIGLNMAKELIDKLINEKR